MSAAAPTPPSVSIYELISHLHSLATPCYNLSETMPQPVNSSFVLQIIHGLFSLYSFRAIVFYVSAELSDCYHLAEDFLQSMLLSFPLIPKIFISHKENSSESYEMATFLKTPSLCLVLTTSRDDPIMELTARSLDTVRSFPTIFVLFPLLQTAAYYSSFEQQLIFNATIEDTCRWMWRKQFLKTVLLTIDRNVYMLQPYPKASVMNLTSNWNLTKFFADHTQNMQGYAIKTQMHEDIPRVFRTRRKRIATETRLLSGVSALIIQGFAEYINATIIDTTNTNVVPTPPFTTLLTALEKGNFELLLNSYTKMQADELDMSYPLGINDWCFMVPYHNRTPEFLHLQIVFDREIWLLYALSMLFISLAIWLFTPAARRDLSSAWLQSVCCSLFIPPLAILGKTQRNSLRSLSTLLFIYGFCVTMLYTTKLASFLTSPPQPPQINSERDVIAMNLHLMLNDFELKQLEGRASPRFLRQLLAVSSATLSDHRFALNTSYGYSVGSDRWIFINKQQRHLHYPFFRLSEICVGPFYHIFPLQRNSHFKEPLQRFIMMAQQFGLVQHWQELAFQDALWDGTVQVKLINQTPIALSMNFFRLIWFIWYLGLMLSGFVFILEIKGCEWQRSSGRV